MTFDARMRVSRRVFVNIDRLSTSFRVIRSKITPTSQLLSFTLNPVRQTKLRAAACDISASNS